MNKLKKQVFNFLNLFSDHLSLNSLIRCTHQRLFLPFYHTISDEDLPHIKHLYPIRSQKQFKEDLDFILKYFVPIDFNELKNIIDGQKKISENCFFLSFDDGLSEIYHIVAPILKEKGIPAAIFLNTDFVDNKNLFFRYKASLLVEAVQSKGLSEVIIAKIRAIFLKHSLTFPTGVSGQGKNINKGLLKINYHHKELLDEIATVLEIDYQQYLKEKKPYLDTWQIQELIRDGFIMGAHSVDHPEYSTIKLEEQLYQTKESIRFVNDKFAVDHKIFSFPFTDSGVSKTFFENIFNSQDRMVDISFGGAGLKKDSFPCHLQRFPMEGTRLTAQKLITTEYLYYLLKIPFGKNRIIRINDNQTINT